ncbi:lactococcin 972 family bacteriocin [Nocardiopsis halotolerans]|uniref:lactococcin 972 family bacteriocin n=1 Tax=Nocardiopsis halotolerans TaxID=124252 RepID=UPI000344C0F0|nr:lactococcin 972 family bacteriocin [Nocardiopsis halotolerans]
MKNSIRRTAATVLLASGLAVGATGTALAVVEYVGGGRWEHGFSAGSVYSNYFHGGVCHGSTAVGTYTDRTSAPAGYTSYATAPEARWGNKTYWRTSC